VDSSLHPPGGSHPARRLLIDCGTGLRHVDVDPAGPGVNFDILFSHFHWDHIEGLGFLAPIFMEQHHFSFYGHPEGMTVREALEGALCPPWFPIALSDTPSAKTYQRLETESFTIGDVQVTPCALNHPQGVLGYRFDRAGKSIAFATDHEAGDPAIDAALLDWARGADVLVHDAQYTDDDYEAHRGWGHSTWHRAVDTAIAAGVGRLVTISHAPTRTDDELDALTAIARKRFPNTEAGRAGMVITA